MVRETRAITLRRVERVLDSLLLPAEHPASAPVDLGAWVVGGEPVPFATAVGAAYAPFAPGERWGRAWDTTWFRVTGSVPAEWAGRRVVLRFDVGHRDADPGGSGGFGAEALVWSADGAPVQGLSGRHRECLLVDAARGGDPIDLFVEAASNPDVAALESAGELLAWRAVDVAGPPLFTLLRADLAVVDPAVRSAIADLTLALELARSLPADSRRGAEVLTAVDDFCNRLDPDDVTGSLAAALQPVAAALGRPAAASAHRIVAVGHAHIDTAWLWPLRETPRKCARTFATACRLLDEYPVHRFAVSQPQHWAWIKERHPDLFDRMRKHVAAGRIEPAGAFWIEPDCNVPGGEALARQLLHGWRFFKDELGVEVDHVWEPDVFGYAASLPGLMAAAGIHRFVTQKLSWNRTNRMPHHTFWWEGIDGSRVLCHFPPIDTYNAELTVDQLLHAERNFADHATASVSLAPFGYGDGGGGPTRELIERARRIGDVEGLPRVRVGTVGELLDEAEAELVAAGDLAPVWVGELYLEMHRGTYTSQARAKQRNRQLQRLLRDTELLSALAPDPWPAYPADGLDRSWKDLLTLQFHDILPGSSIGWVYDEATAVCDRIEAELTPLVGAAASAVAEATDTLDAADPVVVFNPSSHPQRLSGLADVIVPPLGTAVVDRAAPIEPGDAVAVADGRAENAQLRIEWDGRGLLTSVWDKEAGREVLAGPGNRLWLFDDRPVEYDAWDVDGYFEERGRAWDGVDSLTVVDGAGPWRGGFRVRRSTPAGSTIEQTVTLGADTRTVEITTEIDWRERHTLLKAAFPLTVRSPRATYEIQWGAVERPTHRNTSWDRARFEVCAQRWADLSEAGYGVALLNDSHHGYDCHGSVLRLSLLRSPTAPDPEADQGHHSFRYALLPHAGSWQEGGVVEAAEVLNQPLRLVPAGRHAGRRAGSYLSVDDPGVMIEAVKRAEDADAWIVRLYEAWGGRRHARLRVDLPVTTARRVDLLERDLAPIPLVDGALDLDLGPFQILTLRLDP